jgi:hypothetical protein
VKMPRGHRLQLILVVVVVACFVAFAVATLYQHPGPSATSQPVSIVSFENNGKAPPFWNLTIMNTGSAPIENLSAAILASCDSCGFVWVQMYLQSPPNITASSPLIVGQVASFVFGLANTALTLSCGTNYVLITGWYYSGPGSAGTPFGIVPTVQLSCSSQ